MNIENIFTPTLIIKKYSEELVLFLNNFANEELTITELLSKIETIVQSEALNHGVFPSQVIGIFSFIVLKEIFEGLSNTINNKIMETPLSSTIN